MADFRVEVTRVLRVEDHPGADRLSINTVYGFSPISNKVDGNHRYKEGDLVVYFPEASVLPESLLRHMDFWDHEANKGGLSGKDGNRVKALKLRGIFSTGILFPVSKTIDGDNFVAVPIVVDEKTVGFNKYTVTEGQDVAKLFGITKYEPPIPERMAGEVLNLFGKPMRYDFDAWERVPDIIDDGEEVVGHEKTHGTWTGIGYDTSLNNPELFGNGNIFVGSKGLSAQGLVFKNNIANNHNLYVKALRELLADGFADRIRNLSEANGGGTVHVFGETFGRGVQDLGYGFDKPVLRVFDIAINGHYLGHDDFVNASLELGLKTVPLLYRGPFNVDVLKGHRDGKTVFNGGPNIREGVVVKTVVDSRHAVHGRKICKLISPAYSLRKAPKGGELTENQ